MHPHLSQTQTKSLLAEASTYKKLVFNKTSNVKQDHTALIDEAAASFAYDQDKEFYWNPVAFSLMYGTPLWDQASADQKRVLNHLYWVAYYSQIISAEIATIYLNQVAAAGLYALEDFRIVCDTLDLESSQERAHIQAFKTISEEVEFRLFGERVFTYPMRGWTEETMVFADTHAVKRFWRKIQMQAYASFSTGSAFLASQYLLIRGLRTLNGKLVQHELSKHYTELEDQDSAPVPSKISYYHFMDESYHFNTSKIVGLDIAKFLEAPTWFETWAVNRAVLGCQKDHSHFSIVVNGIFWFDPALLQSVYKILKTPVFGLNHREAVSLLGQCFCVENEGMHQSLKMHKVASQSYQAFVDGVAYLSPKNRDMTFMRRTNLEGYLAGTQKAFRRARFS